MALINLKSFREFFRSGSTGGIILIFCVFVSLVIANSPYSEGFVSLLDTSFGLETETIHLRYSVLIWINDGLMAIFFLLIGLEIKRELVEGELSSARQAALPVFAAFGGAIVPAIIYFTINKNSAAANGWGIPMATDIAFAISVVTLLGKKVPPSLKIFLAALAIVDDLIAILVIAIFYSAEIHLDYLFIALGIFGLLVVFNRMNVKSLWFYLIPGIFIWYFTHHSGIHATIAGVLTAMTIPTTKGSEESPLEKLEHHLHKPVNFLIMPVFALANTNISFGNASVNMLTSGLGLGIIIGLIAGKPIGIVLLSWITVKLKWSVLPARAHWGHILGLGILGGIGFTMSIFIALLSFEDEQLQTASKFSILMASTCAGIIGYITLYMMRKKSRASSR